MKRWISKRNQTTPMCSFQEIECFFFAQWWNVLTLQTAHGKFLMLCQIALLPNINFLINKTGHQRLIQKCWGSMLSLLFLTCLVVYKIKQSFIIKYKECKWINKYLYCYELHSFFSLFVFWYHWYTEQVFMFIMYLFPISII